MDDVVRAGGALKIRYPVEKSNKGWIRFNPANLHVELNGQRIDYLQELTLTIKDSVPTLNMTFTLTDVDIDVDTLMALKAIIESKREGGS